MVNESERESENASDSKILILIKDLAEVIDILHTEISEMKKVLKIIKTDVEIIKDTKLTKSESYMHG
jgi:hypothetical protein